MYLGKFLFSNGKDILLWSHRLLILYRYCGQFKVHNNFFWLWLKFAEHKGEKKIIHIFSFGRKKCINSRKYLSFNGTKNHIHLSKGTQSNVPSHCQVTLFSRTLRPNSEKNTTIGLPSTTFAICRNNFPFCNWENTIRNLKVVFKFLMRRLIT